MIISYMRNAISGLGKIVLYILVFSTHHRPSIFEFSSSKSHVSNSISRPSFFTASMAALVKPDFENSAYHAPAALLPKKADLSLKSCSTP